IGLNVAVRDADLPLELQGRAGTLGLSVEAVEPTLSRLLETLERWVLAPPDAVLEVLRDRDALLGREVRWAGGAGEAAGVDGDGRLVVATGGGQVTLEAGEVHLG
ncbi:MAG TPA: hypothetical protein VMP89_04075, partial [Solirubrobacteraceae bacterium]|nr:hypothetical protein [Solirubrobacteraceae bacterium]